MGIDLLAVYAIFALGNQFRATCPAVSADALLTGRWMRFAIIAPHPRGESSVNDLSFLPVSPPAVAPAAWEHRDALQALRDIGLSLPFKWGGRRPFEVLALDVFVMPERGK